MEHKCPVCHGTVEIPSQERLKEARFFPFCSQRCKLVDLGVWLDARYKITSKLQSQELSTLSGVPSAENDR